MTSGHNVSSELTKQTSGPVIPINDLRGEDGIGYSHEEKRLRCQLATIYRLVDLHGWSMIIYNHISLKNNSSDEEFFINPMGLLYREITAASLVKISIKGQTVDPGTSVFGINKAGWSLHAALHSCRPDIRCVVHTHVPDVIAISCLKYGLLPISPEAVELLDESSDSLSRGVRYHNYWGLAITTEEWPSIKEDIGPHSKILFLRNHGLVICASNCIEAWILLKRVINACENQVRLLQTKGEEALLAMNIKTVDKSVNEIGNDEESSLKSHRITSAELEFEAMMRMLDNAGYRTGYSYCHGNLLRKGCGVNYFNDEMAVDSTLANLTDLSLDATHMNGSNPNKLSNKALATRQKAAQRNQWLIKTMSPDENIQEELNNCD